jgi:hypothetical protein
MKIKLQWSGGSLFVAIDPIDQERIEKRFVPNRIYEVEFKTRRNLKKHQLYWVLLNAIAFHFGGGAGDYHYELKKKFMPPRIISGKKGTLFELAPSEAFDSCTEDQFTEYFEKVQRWLIEQGYEPMELIETAN